MRGKRILFLTPYFAPELGAAPVRVTAIADGLAELGWEVRVCTGMPNYPEGVVQPEYRRAIARRETRDSGVRVLRFRTVAGRGSGWRRYANFVSTAMISCLPLFARWKPDFVVAETPPPSQFLSAHAVAWRWRAKTVSSVADLWPETPIRLGLFDRHDRIIRLASLLEGRIYAKSDKLVAVTESIASHLVTVRQCDPSNILTSRNGVDLEFFHPGRMGSSTAARFSLTKDPFLVYAGSLGLPTDPLVLVRLADELASHGITVLVVGSGSEFPAIKEAARTRENLRVFASQPPELISELYRGCLAGLVTLAKDEFFEGTLPAKMLPILGSGAPVIFAGRGEGAELVTEAGAGAVAAPGDAIGMASIALTLRDNPDIRRRMGERGRAYAESRLSWARCSSAWSEFLLS
jgi:colanic acid biosynthesis glycosyl transferase WcaI